MHLPASEKFTLGFFSDPSQSLNIHPHQCQFGTWTYSTFRFIRSHISIYRNVNAPYFVRIIIS